MKTLNELTKAQKEELKQALLIEREDCVSFAELCDCDNLVTDDELEAKWGGTMFSDDDFACSCDTLPPKASVDTYVMEGSKGKFLRINATEDGNGAWFDWTPSIWEAYWNDLGQLKEIALGEFSDFDEGYPKFHHVRFTCENLETIEED